MSKKLRMQLGIQFPSQLPPEIDPQFYLQGLQDALSKADPAIDPATFAEVFNEFGQIQQAKAQAEQARIQAEQAAKGDENRAKGVAYLAAKAEEAGVQKTESGILYEVITPAEGAKPEATSQVKVHYRGTLIDGTEFDSSYKRGQPATFGLNQVIPGWTEGVQLMNTGSKYRFHIPSELAYGTQAPPNIGPNQTLVFEVELLEIVE